MRIHHLGFVGSSLDRLRRRFLDEGAETLTPPIEDPLQRVVLQFVREPRSEELWELIVPAGPVEGSPLASRLSHGGGLDHVCYELGAGQSLEEQLAIEERRGARVICPPVLAAAFNRRIAFVFRRSGRVIEFVEARPPDCVI
jgi:hypothetical protein